MCGLNYSAKASLKKKKTFLFLRECVCVIMCVLELRSASWDREASYLQWSGDGKCVYKGKWQSSEQEMSSTSFWLTFRLQCRASGLLGFSDTRKSTQTRLHTSRHQTPLLKHAPSLVSLPQSVFMEVKIQIQEDGFQLIMQRFDW